MLENMINIEDFSKHLFWDVDKNTLDLEKHKRYIINRVLDYGLMKDWRLIHEYYGIDRIGEIATEIRDLDPKSLSFVSLLSGIPIDKFRCYTNKQLSPPHWHF